MDAALLLIGLLLVAPLVYAAYRKFRRDSREGWQRMPPGDGEPVELVDDE